MKKVISLVLIIIIALISVLRINSYAITLPWLEISSNNYPSGKVTITDEEKDKVEVGETLQLYACIFEGHDVYDPSEPDGGIGRYCLGGSLQNITWSSSDTTVATIDNQGKVIGIKEGTTIITAINNETTNFDSEKQATKEIEVIKAPDMDISDYSFLPTVAIRTK